LAIAEEKRDEREYLKTLKTWACKERGEVY
jgi:hypothetical protein